MTDNPAALADPGTFTVRRSIRIDASVDKVWRAVTEPEHVSRWFGRLKLDGDAGTISWPDRQPIPIRRESVDPQRSVSYRWNNDDALGTAPEALDETTATVFTFTLEPDGAGTRLTVVETGFDLTSDPRANLDSHARGWTTELDELVALVEAAA
jgi:uncharacterized protein YndB with AHSA1/START domain